MRVARVVSVLLAALLLSAQAHAAGFRLPEAGAKAMGMSMAFTAQADDPSAIYYNPAGLVQLEGTNVMVGGTYVRENGGTFTGESALSRFDTVSPNTETQKDLNFVLPNAYWTRTASSGLAYGIGIFTPFGLGQEYKDRDTGIFRNQVNMVEIQTVVVNPTVAWEIDNVLSIGVGIDFMYGKAILKQTIPNPAPPFPSLAYVDLEGDGTAWGYNFGLLLTPSKSVRVGFNYRSPFTLEIHNADATFEDAPGGPSLGLSTKASTQIDMPATAALGVAWTSGRLTLEADADLTMWSRFETLTINFNATPAPLIPTSVTRDEDWNDVIAYRFGGEYRVTEPLALRLGFAYDPTPVPANTMSPLLPDADRLFYSIGAGYKAGKWTFDVSYLYIDKKDRTVDNLNDADTGTNNFAGTWTGDAHLLAFDVAYRF